MNLKQNAELIQYYLRYLKLRKEKAQRNQQISAWEKLTYEEKLQIATDRYLKEQQEHVEAQVRRKLILVEYYNSKAQARRNRKSKSYKITKKSDFLGLIVVQKSPLFLSG